MPRQRGRLGESCVRDPDIPVAGRGGSRIADSEKQSASRSSDSPRGARPGTPRKKARANSRRSLAGVDWMVSRRLYLMRRSINMEKDRHSTLSLSGPERTSSNRPGGRRGRLETRAQVLKDRVNRVTDTVRRPRHLAGKGGSCEISACWARTC